MEHVTEFDWLILFILAVYHYSVNVDMYFTNIPWHINFESILAYLFKFKLDVHGNFFPLPVVISGGISCAADRMISVCN